MADSDILTAADQAFVASMQAIDAESDAAVRGQSAKIEALVATYLAKVTERINSPLKTEDEQPPAS